MCQAWRELHAYSPDKSFISHLKEKFNILRSDTYCSFAVEDPDRGWISTLDQPLPARHLEGQREPSQTMPSWTAPDMAVPRGDPPSWNASASLLTSTFGLSPATSGPATDHLAMSAQ